jgi:hypothetical protein
MNATVERDLMSGFSVGSRHSKVMVVYSQMIHLSSASQMWNNFVI